VQLLLCAALCAPLAAAQADHSGASPGSREASAAQLARFQELVQLARPAAGPLGLRAAAMPADLFAEMAGLAAAGLGPARAWCARHLDDAPAETGLSPEAAGEHLVRLAFDHAGEPWLLDPALDPLRSVERAPEGVRTAVDAALAAADAPHGEGRALALALRAVALAPRTSPDPERRARALALLGELLERYPASAFAPRAQRLAWRILYLSPGLQAPELTLRDVDGNELRLSLMRGRPVLVDAWSWDEEDLLSRSASRRALLARHPRGSLALLGIARGCEDPLDFRRLLEELDLDGATAFEPSAGSLSSGAWLLDPAPTTVLLDGEGVVRAVGLEGAELEAAIERLLAACAGREAPPGATPSRRPSGAPDR